MPSVTWQVSTDAGVNWRTVTAADGTLSTDGKTLTVAATEALSGFQFRAVATNVVGTVESAAAKLTVSPATGDGGDSGEPGAKDEMDAPDVPGLASTGGRAAPFIAVAVVTMLAGAGLVFASRRRRA